MDRIQVKLERVLSGLGIRLSGRVTTAPAELGKPTMTWRNAVTPLHGPVPSMSSNTADGAHDRGPLNVPQRRSVFAHQISE